MILDCDLIKVLCELTVRSCAPVVSGSPKFKFYSIARAGGREGPRDPVSQPGIPHSDLKLSYVRGRVERKTIYIIKARGVCPSRV